jgi:hypothetical protein
MSVELKIKSKHLSVEAQIIRFEECKLKKQVAWARHVHHDVIGYNTEYEVHKDNNFMTYVSLNRHRRWDVRNENRATFLARAYIEGVAYSSVEQKRKPENEYRFSTYIIPRVVAMVAKYGDSKVPLKVWDSASRSYVNNPALAQITKDVIKWSTIVEAEG